ncbi:hypothetical protein, partial [Salmonella enterica]|uniref:hypothetical protein n=1 Tax=Salmonella enterica TaxID=28901 RepID=UPI00329854F2
ARIAQHESDGSALLDYVERTLGRALAGVHDGERWCAAGHPAARTGRYRSAAARFEAAALVFAGFPALGLSDLAAPCREAAGDLRA